MDKEYICDTVSSKKTYTSFELRSESRKKEKRITNILEITNSLSHTKIVNHTLNTHKFINKLSLEKKIFVILFNLFIKNKEIFKLINLLKKYPGKRKELLKYNMTEFEYSKELDFNQVVYYEIFKYVSNFMTVKHNYEEYTRLLGSSKPEVVALFVLLKDFNLEFVYQACNLHEFCELHELKNVICKINKIKKKKRNFSEKMTVKKVFDSLLNFK
ncbi:hypothetical protein TUBRATIS_003580 [Tubulinosema ratisbonensis]|uniref:Uncharacterized protein n=1 Tax=Tubulinosema ratisbonensis TaxID=291195 RepID=A0A437APF7_9MICR|nr:hypothetical protein TUBRATIS_003580 [Tubulinosema ratisbonensis]